MSDGKTQRWCPDVCPITLRPFFMWIENEDGEEVPTYGGPYDSYTIPEPDIPKDGQPKKRFDIEYTQRRYDHDQGGWTDEVIVVDERVTYEEVLIDLGAWD